MSRIIACYKWVKSEEDLRVNPDLTVDFSRAKGKISDYDRNAIETARLAAAAMGADAVGLTYGGADAASSTKEALSRGLKEVFRVNDDQAAEADGSVTAKSLAAAIKRMDDVGLIVCSEGASDTYAHQVGPRIGALLDLPVISFVIDMKVEGNILNATRKLEHFTETVEVELPCVVTVMPEINAAPIPGLKAVLEAAKKPVTVWQAADIGTAGEARKTSVASLKGYAMTRKNVLFGEGTAAEKVSALVAALKNEGVL